MSNPTPSTNATAAAVLPSATYARSKLRPPPTVEIQDAELEKAEEKARNSIIDAFKEGNRVFRVYSVSIPESVRQEMRDLGWIVEYNDYSRVHIDDLCRYDLSSNDFYYSFSLPAE